MSFRDFFNLKEKPYFKDSLVIRGPVKQVNTTEIYGVSISTYDIVSGGKTHRVYSNFLPAELCVGSTVILEISKETGKYGAPILSKAHRDGKMIPHDFYIPRLQPR